MAYVPRILFLRSKSFTQNAGGILSSFSQLPTVDFNSLINSVNKGNTIGLMPKRFCTYGDYKSLAHLGTKLNVFGKIYLPTNPNVSESSLLDTFSRIIKTCNKYEKKNFFFKKDLQEYVSSRDFKMYCQVLEQKLHEMSPTSLIIFYDFINFPNSSSQGLTNKICAQILNSLNNFQLIEKLCIYDKVAKKCFTHKESNKIKKACEAYFEKYFETDVLHMAFCDELLLLLNVNTLPKSMRQIVANKLLEDAIRKTCSQKDMIQLIEKLSLMNSDIRPKAELKDLLHLCVIEFSSVPLLTRFSTAYKNLVQQDSFYYSKDILDVLFFKSLTKIHKSNPIVQILLNLCMMGYVSEDMIDRAVQLILCRAEYNVHSNEVMTYVDFLVRSSFQYTCQPSVVSKVRSKLESFNIKENSLPFLNLCKCCEGLTYLGCDTRSLCNVIFQNVTENFKDTITSYNVLFLHHLAKVCLKSGYEALSEQILSWLLRAEITSNGALPSENLNEYFGCEDYILQNCVTSEKHCLHFVSVFGPDNEPIDLSRCNQERLKSVGQFLEFEKIKKPPGSKVIAFQKFKDLQPIQFYTRPIMSGAAKMYLKSFENVDCSIVLLPEKFFNLIPKKKKEYLTSEIEQILNISKTETVEN